jgi:hypothetical protein
LAFLPFVISSVGIPFIRHYFSWLLPQLAICSSRQISL